MTGRIQDKIAIITGAGSGIGEATAIKFAQEGSKVVIAEINAENGKKVWEVDPLGPPARRGLVYWPGKNNKKSRIYFCAQKKLISINPKNGYFVNSFGKKGIVNLKRRCKYH